jgi:transcriptional regulator with XRE-family HTH domain
VEPRIHQDAAKSVVLRKFGERLRELRLARNLTQEALAADAGFSRSYYTEIETGKRNISLLNIHKLSVCLKVNIKELLDIDEGQDGKD